MTQVTFGYLQKRLFTARRTHIYIYIHTDTAHVLHVYVGLAQARPNYHIIDYTVWRCRDSRSGKQGRDDGMKQFSIQPHLTYHIQSCIMKDICRGLYV